MSKKCIRCGAELPDEALFCHACESPQQPPQTPRIPRTFRKKTLLFAAAAVLIAVFAALCLLPEDRGNTAAVPIPSETTAPASPSPSPTPSPEPASETRYLSRTEAIYTDADGSYRIYASFNGNGAAGAGSDHFSATSGRLENLYKPTFIHVLDAATGAPVKEEFFEKIRSVKLLIAKPNSIYPEETISPEKCQMDAVLLEAAVHYAYNTGDKELRWQIELTNDVLLEFTQTMSITPKAQAVYNASNTPLNTMEDLRALTARIEAEVPADAEVIIELPPVQYSGTLELNRSYNFIGSADGDARTTFTDTVICRAPEANIICFFDILFLGEGRGTGIEDHCGVFLGGCTLRNWDIAARTGTTGWLGVIGCTIENNGIGLQYNTNYFWYSCNTFTDDIFRGNGVAIEINSMPRVNMLTFPGSVFTENGENLVNRTDQPVAPLPE